MIHRKHCRSSYTRVHENNDSIGTGRRSHVGLSVTSWELKEVLGLPLRFFFLLVAQSESCIVSATVKL